MQKPILFLDFDRTLFDTTQMRIWLGDAIESRIHEVEQGILELPDLLPMLYPDTLPFLRQARATHRLVLLTSTTHPVFQEKKVRGSGVIPYLDDVLITDGGGGNSGKGAAAQEYLRGHDVPGDGHVFVDDLPLNLSEVRTLNPGVRCIQIKRMTSTQDAVSLAGSLPPDGKVANLEELLTVL